jgi:hypothetical protein
VSLAGPDGRLLGGGVAGLLIAASPIQVFFFSLAVAIGNNTSSLKFSYFISGLQMKLCFKFGLISYEKFELTA